MIVEKPVVLILKNVGVLVRVRGRSGNKRNEYVVVGSLEGVSCKRKELVLESMLSRGGIRLEDRGEAR
jgi:hypothetical protein